MDRSQGDPQRWEVRITETGELAMGNPGGAGEVVAHYTIG